MQPVQALTNTFEAHTSGSSEISWPTFNVAQELTLSNNYRDNVFLVRAYMYKVGTPGDLTIQLYSDSGGAPDTILKSWTFPESSINTSIEWISVVSDTWTFPDYNETDYYISFLASSDSSNYYVYGYDSSGGYSGGSMWKKEVSWTDLDPYDLKFEFDWQYNIPITGTKPNEVYPIGYITNISIDPTLNWTTGSDPDGDTPLHYKVFGTFVDSSWQTDVTYSPPTLSENTTYSWNLAYQDDWCYDKGNICGWSSVNEYFTTGNFTPAASITNLTAATVTTTSINWTWDNPTDSDFNYTMIYKNGAFVTNTSLEYNLMAGLTASTNYTISTHTVDNAGNINSTWVNLSQVTSAACGSDSVCQLENGSVMYWTNSTYRYAQTVLITTPSPYDAIVELDALWLNVSKTGTPGDITIEIMETNATDYPSDHDITCTATLAEADVSTSFTLESISLPNDPTKGYTCTGQGSLAYISFGSPTTLAFAITATGLNTSNYYSYRMSPTKTFADGYLYLDSSGLYVEDVYDGVWVQNTTNDLYFELFYHPNRRPNAPSNTAPSNNANNTSVALNLEWSAGSDDDGDSLTYTPIVTGSSSFSCSLISGLSCFVSSLTTNTTYDWYIVPTDPWQIGTNSTTWNFTTRPPFNDTYVKWNGSDSASGEDWDNALDTISYAINYSVNSVYSIIHIGMGNYSADPEITVGTLAMFWADTSGPMQNTSEVWIDMPALNISS